MADHSAKTGKKVNEFQKAVLQTYGDGDFRHLAAIDDYDTLQETIRRDHSDGLLEFMMSDLLSAESLDDAIQRVEQTEKDAVLALAGLGALVEAHTPKR